MRLLFSFLAFILAFTSNINDRSVFYTNGSSLATSTQGIAWQRFDPVQSSENSSHSFLFSEQAENEEDETSSHAQHSLLNANTDSFIGNHQNERVILASYRLQVADLSNNALYLQFSRLLI